jgi:hypothetical protein
MKMFVLAGALVVTLPALAGAPSAVWIDTTGTFDSNRVLTGTFKATGAITSQGTFIDAPRFEGQAAHVVRSITTSSSEYMTIEINGNHVAGNMVPPTWCPPPAGIPAGTTLVSEFGNWRLVSASGKYVALQGGGAWASWVAYDSTLGIPVSAKECLSGEVH